MERGLARHGVQKFGSPYFLNLGSRTACFLSKVLFCFVEQGPFAAQNAVYQGLRYVASHDSCTRYL